MISESKLIEMYNVHPSWAAVIQDLLSLPQAEALKSVLGRDADCTVPSKYNMFNAFSVGVEDVRCVIIGQDVYPNDNALGYSFAIPKDASLTPSLQIISEELVRTNFSDLREGENRELKYLVSQGVLLLNRALTTRKGKSNAHAKV